MILFSVGLPGRFADWCDALIERLAHRRGGSVAAVALNSLDELASAAIRTRADNLVACCRQPVLRLQSEIVGADLPFVLALGEPRAALRDRVERMGLSVADATRTVASSCATLLTMAEAPRALVLSAEDAGRPAEIAAAIARHFDLVVAEADLRRLVAELGDPDLGQTAPEEASWSAGFTAREQAIVKGALDPYVRYFADGSLPRLVWEPELFHAATGDTETAARPASGAIDITGRARFLVYGPYVNLPAGQWSATVPIAFSAEATGISLVVEVTAGRQLTYTRVRANSEQVIGADLSFAITDALNHPVEIRIISERAAFDGRIALGPVQLIRHVGARPEMEQQLIAVLRR